MKRNLPPYLLFLIRARREYRVGLADDGRRGNVIAPTCQPATDGKPFRRSFSDNLPEMETSRK